MDLPIKEQDGSHLLVYAGGEFVGSLIDADLIDEYHLSALVSGCSTAYPANH